MEQQNLEQPLHETDTATELFIRRLQLLDLEDEFAILRAQHEDEDEETPAERQIQESLEVERSLIVALEAQLEESTATANEMAQGKFAKRLEQRSYS